jgi:enolase
LSSNILSIRAREVLDSRGNPTIEVEVLTESGFSGTVAVPSGASTGRYEAVELRDGGQRYHDKGVEKAVGAVEKVIFPKLKGEDVREQKRIDELMITLDGTENKRRLGGNSILGVSLACAKAAAASDGLQLYEYIDRAATLVPVPFFNIINGGKHAGNRLDFQEFMVTPTSAGSFREALRMGSEVYQTLREQLQESYGRLAINVGDEGGFAPPMTRPEEALEALDGAIQESGYTGEARLAIDVAASTFYKDGAYTVAGKQYSTGEIIEYYREMAATYPVVSIEDPLQEEDFEGFSKATRCLPIQVVGDDLFVMNPKRLKKGIETHAANALLWKVNQVGTLTEALEAAEIAKRNGYAVMASHRSGDTEDAFLADLAAGIGCGQMKSGSPARGERTAKYNRLLRIEERLGGKAQYPRLFK